MDLAAFEAATACALEISGWVPLDFTNEHGKGGIPDRYRPYLWQTASTESAERTERNMREADGILTLLLGDAKSPGTRHGIEYAKQLGKTDEQLFFVNLSAADLLGEQRKVVDWLKRGDIKKCAIGGPRESEAPGIQQRAYELLLAVFRQLQQRSPPAFEPVDAS